MKVPTYTSQVQRTSKVAGQRSGVRMDIGAATKAARTTSQAFDLVASETQAYYDKEFARRKRLEQMKVQNEYEDELTRAQEQADELSITDPDRAENEFTTKVDEVRSRFSKNFTDSDERELFEVRFDGTANRFSSKVRTGARTNRLRIGQGIWTNKAQNLTNKAYEWDETAIDEIFGNKEKGIPSHFDFAVSEGYMTPEDAETKKSALRVDIAKQRLAYKFNNANLETLQGYLSSIDEGNVPEDLQGEWSKLTPAGVDKFKTALRSDIKTIETANKAAEALLSDDQLTAYYKLAKNPDTKLSQLQDKLEEFLTTDVDGMNNADERSVISALSSAISVKGTQTKSAISSIKDERADLQKILDGGLVPSQERVDALVDSVSAIQTQMDPDDVRDVYNLKVGFDQVKSMSAMGNAELNSYLTAHSAATRNKATSADLFVAKQGQKILESRRTAFDQGDLMGLAVRQGVVAAPPSINPFSLFELGENGFVQNPDGSLRIDQSKMAAFQARRQMSTVVQQHFGYGQKQFLNRQEAHQFRTVLDQTGPEQFGLRLSMLQTLVTGFGADAKDVIGEIVGDDKKYKKYGHIGMLLVEGHPEAAEMALRGMDYLETGGILAASKSEMDTAFQNHVKDAFFGIDGAGVSARQTAEAIYAHKARTETMFDADAFEEAIDMAVGKTGDRGGIGEVNGGKTVLPSNMDAGKAEDAIGSITLEQLQDPEVSGQDVTERDVRNINRSDWKLYLDPESGRYQLYTGSLDADGIGRGLSLDKDEDQPIVIDFENWQKKYGNL